MLRTVRSILVVSALLLTFSGCNGQWMLSPPTPTVDPDIYNQVPDTTVFEPGDCIAVLDEPAPGYTSNTLGGQSSGVIAAGSYEVVVAADYGSSLWYQLMGVDGANYVNSVNVTSTTDGCST